MSAMPPPWRFMSWCGANTRTQDCHPASEFAGLPLNRSKSLERSGAMETMTKSDSSAGKVAIDLGLKPGGLQKVGAELVKVLADSYLLYLKTQNFHWNVTGPAFSELHLLFENQYQDLALAVDEIAERVRAIGM